MFVDTDTDTRRWGFVIITTTVLVIISSGLVCDAESRVSQLTPKKYAVSGVGSRSNNVGGSMGRFRNGQYFSTTPRTTFTEDEPVLDAATVCNMIGDMNRKQIRLCRQYPDVTASAIQGIQMAIHECQFQFRYSRWNCSALETLDNNPWGSTMMQHGYKESAFAYAIIAAGVTHAVAKACSMGKLGTCSCDTSKLAIDSGSSEWIWGGCGHNVAFGNDFAQRFLDAREKGKHTFSKTILHNYIVGRKTVINNMEKKCKCHGMSGSCEIKTCWMKTVEMRETGDLIKDRYLYAHQVRSDRGRLTIAQPSITPWPRDNDLIYVERSPNYCDEDVALGSHGTSGRLCNRTTPSPQYHCESMCCGRGYNIFQQTRRDRCNCKFHWCCYVVCDECVINEWVSVCK